MIAYRLQTGVVGDSVVKFNVVNLTKPDSLFAMGMRPVLYSHRDAAGKGLGWQRCGHGIDYRRCENERSPSSHQITTRYMMGAVKKHGFSASYLVARVARGGQSVSAHRRVSLAVQSCK